MNDLYITTSIPYVNGAPHLGHALEFVHVDSLARHRRRAEPRYGPNPAPTTTRSRTSAQPKQPEFR
jgi:tRNA synthetases class I (M)